jgi:hypothetical protein
MTNSAEARILAQQRQMQGKLLECGCGSHHFYEVKATKYLGGGQGSVEIMADTTDQEFPLLVCICGRPQSPKAPVGRRAYGVFENAHKDFRESVARAIESIDSKDPQEVKDEVLQAAASKTVEAQVETLMERVYTLEQVVIAPTHDEPTTPVEGSPTEPEVNKVHKGKKHGSETK